MGQRLLHQKLHGERLHFTQRQASFAPDIRQLLDNLQRAGNGGVVNARGEQPIGHPVEAIKRPWKQRNRILAGARGHQPHDIHAGL